MRMDQLEHKNWQDFKSNSPLKRPTLNRDKTSTYRGCGHIDMLMTFPWSQGYKKYRFIYLTSSIDEDTETDREADKLTNYSHFLL